ncbi:phage capsid protein [Levilactobacillus angrenensis]|uniref:phage capsid protein n=1 Tax=Levilactobacillus angrenensis TaxID=2486020 RepID=UPI000F7A1199|nr:phage capsid protein [Levilactobacillus angrenensis]
MAFTKITSLADLIEPQVFLDYVQEQVSNTNAFIKSGVLGADPVWGSRLLQPGRTIDMPYINDLPGDAEEWSDTKDIDTDSLTTGISQAMKVFDNKSYSATDFGQLVTGAPVRSQIISRFSEFWVRQDMKRLLNVLNATYANADILTAKSYGVGTEKELSAGDLLAALARMGDMANPKLVKLAMNSSAYFEMRAQNLIDDVKPSEGGAPISYYNGLQIIQDDDIPVAADGTTAAYAFAPGSVAYATANPANAFVITRDEFKNGGVEAIIQKRVSAMQVIGTDIDTSVVSSISGYRQAIEDGKPVFKVATDPRKLGIVKYGFKVASQFVVPTINSPKADSTDDDPKA